MKARLVEDGGEAAADAEQFFRSPAFLEVEGVTHTLTVAASPELRLPLIARPIGDTRARRRDLALWLSGRDVALPDTPPDPGGIDWSQDAASSAPSSAAASAMAPASPAAPSATSVQSPRATGGSASGCASRSAAIGAAAGRSDAAGGPAAAADARAAFERAYAETMARAGAAERYLFPSEYFERLLREPAQLAAARRPRGAAPGGRDRRRQRRLPALLPRRHGRRGAGRASPMKNLFAAMISLGPELGLPVKPRWGPDARGLARRFQARLRHHAAPFRTHELVCDPAGLRARAERAQTGSSRRG